MAKPILTFLTIAPSFRFFSDPCANTQFQGEPLQRGHKMHGVGKICDFRFKSPFVSETVRDRPVVTWNVNRKSWVPDRTVSSSMTLSDPNPGFQGHGVLTSRISKKRCVLGTKLLKNTNRKPYPVYRMVPLSMTLSDL